MYTIYKGIIQYNVHKWNYIYNGRQIIPNTCILYIRVLYSIRYINGIIYNCRKIIPCVIYKGIIYNLRPRTCRKYVKNITYNGG